MSIPTLIARFFSVSLFLVGVSHLANHVFGEISLSESKGLVLQALLSRCTHCLRDYSLSWAIISGFRTYR
jgi:hypothetical protein